MCASSTGILQRHSNPMFYIGLLSVPVYFWCFYSLRVQLYHLWQAADAANLTPTLTLQNLITRILDHIPYIPLISCKNPPLTLQVIALSKKPAVAVAVRVLAGTCEQQGLVLPRLTAEVKLSCVEYCCQCALRVKSWWERCDDDAGS